MATLYPWVKALHVIAVIAWMAGLLYLPRLFVYHSVAAPGSAQSETFKIMERRLLRGIMNPAMIAVFLLGGLLLATPGVVDWQAAWIYVKLVLVAGLTVLHHMMAGWRKAFAADQNRRSARFYRIANEVPTVLMIGIVIFVIVKPV
ncbi:MAG: protoporphyrinogen oxidase HemJ [Proteobacteria bacterium]|nr:protoporphyrinogen oxidase HemJ [Pseudomonadota bacterium]